MFNPEQLKTLLRLAISAAQAAGEIIAAQRKTGFQIGHKDVGNSVASQVVTEVDHKAQATILQILTPSCAEFDLAMLAEESVDDGQRQTKPAFWCVDPMDGTLAFVNDRPGYAVSIALVTQLGVPLLGVVYDPLAQTLFHALSGQGAYKNAAAIKVPELDRNRPLVLRTDPSFETHQWRDQTQAGLLDIARSLGLNGAEIYYHAGAVMNACQILDEPNLCYFKYPRPGNSGGSVWDYAATACLFQEAGAVVSDLFAQPLDLNRVGSTFMNHRGLLYAANQAVAQRIVKLHQNLD